jgi:hypothetical protein
LLLNLHTVIPFHSISFLAGHFLESLRQVDAGDSERSSGDSRAHGRGCDVSKFLHGTQNGWRATPDPLRWNREEVHALFKVHLHIYLFFCFCIFKALSLYLFIYSLCFVRQAVDYTELYGPKLSKLITTHISAAVRNVILDGELLTFDKETNQFLKFGQAKTVGMLLSPSHILRVAKMNFNQE